MLADLDLSVQAKGEDGSTARCNGRPVQAYRIVVRLHIVLFRRKPVALVDAVVV